MTGLSGNSHPEGLKLAFFFVLVEQLFPTSCVGKAFCFRWLDSGLMPNRLFLCGQCRGSDSLLLLLLSCYHAEMRLFHGDNYHLLISLSSLLFLMCIIWSKSYQLMSFCLCCVFQLDPQTVQSKNWHMDVIEMNGVRRKWFQLQLTL